MIEDDNCALERRMSAWCCFVWLGLVAVVAFSGCSYVRRPPSQPKAQLQSLQLGTNIVAGPITVRSLQIEVMRFADNYAALVARTSDEVGSTATNAEERLLATKWKLEQATAAYIDASGPNPVINALDIVVLATASRMAAEEIRQSFGERAEPLLASHRQLESNAWSLVNGLLKPEQQRELMDLIQEWRRNHPHLRNVTALRFREFMTALGKTPERSGNKPGSIFGLLFLDPMASMDPATAAIEETRNTAERAMYYAQRMPSLLNWQMELLTYEMAVQPETKQLLADTERFAKASEVFAKTTEQLPKVINEQREAAIKQLLDGLVPEEKKAKEILSEARSVVVEARETLKVGSTTADSVNTAIKTLDEFVRSVSKTNISADSTNRRPFDVLDYGTAANQIGAAAKDVTALLASANENASRLAQVQKQTTADAKAVVDHAFAQALKLILVLVISALLAGIIYRVMASRVNRRAQFATPRSDSQQ